MAREGTILKSNSGYQFKLVKELAKGGEGTVYTTDNPSLVAKIYHKPNATVEQKLLCMLRHPLDPKADGIHLLIAWPQAVLYENDVFVGYTMPLVNDTYPIYIVARNNPQHNQDCHKVFPKYDWRYSLMVAYHLAWAVNYIHEHDYIVGDMNSNNIVIHGDGTVTILDVDSFDITDPDTGTRYPCNVGISEFLAPELQGRDLRRASFTKQSDDFALAIHIFILLMNNCHPFTLRPLRPDEINFENVSAVCSPKQSVVQDQKMVNIVNGYCPFIKQIPGFGIPSFAPYITMLPDEIQNAFRKTFGYDAQTALSSISKRTSANLWRVLLYNLFQRAKGDTPDLIRCQVDPEHFYLVSKGPCELCAAKRRHDYLLINPSSQFSNHASATNSINNTKIQNRSNHASIVNGANNINSKQKTVISQQIWSVKSGCINQSEQDSACNTATFYPGDTVYCHFEVTGGVQGQMQLFSFVYTDPSGIAQPKKQLSSPTKIGDTFSICMPNVQSGVHRVEIYDGNRKLAESTYIVSSSSNKHSAKKGIFSRLFKG